jgi:hypothetical protein
MKIDLSTELANLITVTGGLVVCIHAHAGKLEHKGATAKAALETMCEYTSATARLSSFTDEFVLYATGERPNAAPVVESCDRLIRDFEGIKKKVMNEGTINDHMAFEESIACLKGVQSKLIGTAVLN